MPRVYWLKRATPRMKYVHMNHVMEEKERLAEQQSVEAKRKAAERELEEIHAEIAAQDRCIDLEGERSFHRWWNSEEVPDFGPRRERIELVEERIKSLSKHEDSVAEESTGDEKSLNSAEI